MFASAGVTLIVTVDCGITAFDEVAYAKSKGVDVIITDLVIDRSGDEKAKAAVATHNSQTETKESPNG